jgi:cyclase
MLLKKRLIPTLLLKDGRMVKTIKFKTMRDVGDPCTAARVYDAQKVDELIFLDISASKEKRQILFDIAARAAEECFMPLTIGGGVRALEDIRQLLKVGADKVSLNTIAVEQPEFVAKAANEFGRQCVVVCVDVKKAKNGNYEVFIQGGNQPTGLDPVAWSKQAAELGAGEIMIYSVDKDGTMEGYDLDLVCQVSNAVKIPVIACGGAGTLQHLVEGIRIGNASAVAAASIFHFTDQNPIKARTYMMEAGIDVRSIGRNF